jgi:hypothetical protein
LAGSAAAFDAHQKTIAATWFTATAAIVLQLAQLP